MRKLEFDPSVFSYLRKLDPKPYKQVSSKIHSLMSDPTPNDSIRVKGTADLLRADIGEHRIIYKFDNTTVSVVKVGKRNDDQVYKELDRKR